MSFNAVSQSVTNPVNYYLPQYAYTWRGEIVVKYTTEDFAHTYISVSAFTELTNVLHSMPLDTAEISLTHVQTTNGHMCILPDIGRLNRPIIQLDLNNFPDLIEPPTHSAITRYLYIHNCPVLDVSSLSLELFSVVISAPKNKMRRIPSFRIPRCVKRIWFTNCVIGRFTISDSWKTMSSLYSLGRSFLIYDNCTFNYYDASMFKSVLIPNIETPGTTGIAMYKLVPILKRYHSLLVFPLLREISFIQRNLFEKYKSKLGDGSLYEHIHPITFTITLSSNPIRRAFEFI